MSCQIKSLSEGVLNVVVYALMYSLYKVYLLFYCSGTVELWKGLNFGLLISAAPG